MPILEEHNLGNMIIVREDVTEVTLERSPVIVNIGDSLSLISAHQTAARVAAETAVAAKGDVEAVLPKIDQFNDDFADYTLSKTDFDEKYATFDSSYSQFNTDLGSFNSAKQSFDSDYSQFNTDLSGFNTNYGQFNTDLGVFNTKYSTFTSNYSTFDTNYTAFVSGKSDFDTKYSDTVSRHNDVVTKHGDIVTKHGEVADNTVAAQSSANNAASSASSALAAATSAANSASSTVTQPLTAHGSMFEPDASNDLTTPATVANQFTVKAGQYRVNGTLIDLPATVITLPAAPSTSALLSRKDLTYLKEDGTIGIFEGLDDSPTMEQAGFTAVSGEKGLYVNGGVYATPLFAVQRRNQGAYHPAFNEFGCTNWNTSLAQSFGRGWTDSGVLPPLSQADAFNFVASGVADTTTVGAIQSHGKIGTTVYRHDSKFYDAIYLSDILDLRLQATAPTPTQLEPNYWQNKAVAGTLKNFANEGIPKLVVKERGVVETRTTNATAVTFELGSNAAPSFSVGDFVVLISESTGAHVIAGYLSSVNSSSNAGAVSPIFSGGVSGEVASFSRTNGDIYTILKVEYTEATGSENTWTDIIGDPANYPRQWTGVIDYDTEDGTFIVDAGTTVENTGSNSSGVVGNVYLKLTTGNTNLAETTLTNSNWLDLGTKAEFLANAKGVEGFPLLYSEDGESLIPDGTSKEYKMSRKAVALEGVEVSDDNGVSWIENSAGWNGITNAPNSRVSAEPLGRIDIIHYQTPAHIFSDDVNSEVLGGKLGDVKSMAYNLAGYGAAVASDLIGKVPTGALASQYSHQKVFSYSIKASGIVSSSTGSEPKHKATDMGVTGVSAATKSLPYLHTDNNQAQLNVLFKEMVFDVTWGDDDAFTVASNTATDVDSNANTILVGTKSTKLPIITGEG